MSRVLVAMSGGVDSSAAACLLREQGHEVIGAFMRHGQDRWAGCPPDPQESADARRVADRLGIPLHVLDFQGDFDRIVDYFVGEYVAGRTPNPCIACNARLKFGRMFEHADRLGAEFVATGHYARLVRQDDGEIALCRGLDDSKDQSYVLFGMDRRRLPRLMFPLGEHRKEEICGLVSGLGLDLAEKPESQEICFLPDHDHVRLVRQRRGPLDTSGEIVTSQGEVVGHHDGYERFTVGQRKGLRVALGQPRYVVRIEPDSHRVVLGAHNELARNELTAAGANWLVPEGGGEKAEGGILRAQVKIRYRSQPVDASVMLLPGNRFHVRFDRSCYGVAPGQAAVCYQGDRVLGGGWIE